MEAIYFLVMIGAVIMCARAVRRLELVPRQQFVGNTRGQDFQDPVFPQGIAWVPVIGWALAALTSGALLLT